MILPRYMHVAGMADAYLRSEPRRGVSAAPWFWPCEASPCCAARMASPMMSGVYPTPNHKVPNSGPVTKTFTAAAILRLAETGAIRLDGQIGAWLDDLPSAWHSLTVHQLLTHMAGLAGTARWSRKPAVWVSS